MIDEGLLQRMQLVVLRETFDRDDLLAVDVLQRGLAGTNGLAVDHHRARAAQSGAATMLGAGQVEIRPEDPQQSPVIVSVDSGGTPVEAELDGFLHTAPSRAGPALEEFMLLRGRGWFQ